MTASTRSFPYPSRCRASISKGPCEAELPDHVDVAILQVGAGARHQHEHFALAGALHGHARRVQAEVANLVGRAWRVAVTLHRAIVIGAALAATELLRFALRNTTRGVVFVAARPFPDALGGVAPIITSRGLERVAARAGSR